MTAFILALILFFQTASAARPGVVAGQLKTSDASPAVSFRVAAIPAPQDPSRIGDTGDGVYFRDEPITSVLTDEQGRYRLANVPPGRYFIVSADTYYGNTLDPRRADVVTVDPGAFVNNIDFQILKAFGGKVSGRVTLRPEMPPTRALLSGVGLQDMLQASVASDGAFEFGHVPAGTYLIELTPVPAGMGSYRVEVTDKDITGVQLVPPQTHAVTGRIVVENGPIPQMILAFSTPNSYVSAAIKPDGAFSVRVHSARHLIEAGGLMPGYSVASVKAGSQDVSSGLDIGNADVSNIVITIAAPKHLPKLRGRISGVPAAKLSSAKVQLTGPLVGSVEASIRPDGSFEIPALTPGAYQLRVPQVPEIAPTPLVMTWKDAEIEFR